MTTPRLLPGALAVAALLLGSGADWRHFRGTDLDGVAASQPPITWTGAAPIAWEKTLPGEGLSSPILVSGRAVVTASSGPTGERLHVLAFDAGTGERLWERQFWGTGLSAHHPKTSVAAPTPASDGERIFASWSTNDVACLDLDGNLLWYRGLTYDYPNASNTLGMSSSPVVAGGTLVCMLETDAEAFAVGLDVQTGQTRWKIERPQRSNWSSPVLLRGEDGDLQVLLQSAAGVAAVDPTSGDVLWNYDDGASTITSSVVAGGIVYVPSHGITAMRPGRSTPGTAEILWNEGALNPGFASPIVKDDRIYVVNSGGVLSSADLHTGERIWQLRMRGTFSGSPVIAGDHLYTVDESGKLVVVKLGRDGGKIVTTHELGDTVLSTPAIGEDALYIRGEQHLWKVGE